MNVKHATVHWEADGNAVNVDLGFIPEFSIMFESTGQTNPNIYFWFRRFVDDQSMYGLLLTGSSGVVTRVTTAATGLSALDSKYHQVLVESPVPGRGDVKCDVADWSSAGSTAATARDGSSIGTIIRPTTHNNYVYECTTAGTSSGTEPTWGTTPGGTTTDGTTVFTCREEKIVVGGAQGLTVGATTQTDGRECFIAAWGNPRDRDAGDVAEVGANAAV